MRGQVDKRKTQYKNKKKRRVTFIKNNNQLKTIQTANTCEFKFH